MMILFFAGCAQDLVETDTDFTESDTDTDTDADSDSDTDTDTEPANHVEISDLGGGVHQIIVNASGETPIYVELNTGTEVSSAEAWDLSFQRYNIYVNGGTSGTGGVTAFIADGADFATVELPESGWITDTAETPVFVAWYDYNPQNHVLTPADRVYLLQRTNGSYTKIEFLDYYDDSGNSGFPTFKFASVPAPE